jgi:hypothetical protein
VAYLAFSDGTRPRRKKLICGAFGVPSSLGHLGAHHLQSVSA